MSAKQNKLDDIPGRRIEGELFETIYNAIENTISPQDVDPLVSFYRYIDMSVQEAVKRLREDSRDEYFIAFTKLNNNKWNRLYLVNKTELIEYIELCFDEVYGGLDITVADMTYQALFIGNHDCMLMRIPESDFQLH